MTQTLHQDKNALGGADFSPSCSPNPNHATYTPLSLVEERNRCGEIEVQANLDNEFKLIHPALGIVDDVEDKIKESARFVCPRGRSYAEQFTCECTHESCSNVMACFYSKLPNLKAYVDCLPKPVPLRLSRPVCGKCSRYQTTFCTFDDLRDAITRDDVACTDFEAYPTRRRR